MTTPTIVGYSIYVNGCHWTTCENLEDAFTEANRYNRFNEVDVLPMWRFNKEIDMTTVPRNHRTQAEYADLFGKWLKHLSSEDTDREQRPSSDTPAASSALLSRALNNDTYNPKQGA